MKKYYKKLGENFIKKGCLQIGRFYDKLRNNGKIMIYRDNKCKEKISEIDNKFIRTRNSIKYIYVRSMNL